MRTSACPGCTLVTLSGNHPGPELARGDRCDCGFASCREPHCPSEPSRCVELSADDPEVWWCEQHCPPLCVGCGEVAVPRAGLWCVHCWQSEQAAVVRGARVLLPALRHAMAWRRRHYEPPVPRHAFDYPGLLDAGRNEEIGTTARLAISDPSRESLRGVEGQPSCRPRGSATSSEKTGGAGNQHSLTVAADSVRGDGIRSLQRAHRYGESPQGNTAPHGASPAATTGPVTHALAPRGPADGETLPAPDGDAETAVAPTSIRTVYDLVRSPGGLAMLVVS